MDERKSYDMVKSGPYLQKFYDLTPVLRDCEAVAFLSYLISKEELYHKQGALIDGQWFYVKVAKVDFELGLGRKAQARIVAMLKARGMISMKLMGTPSQTRYFGVHYKAIADAIVASKQAIKSMPKRRNDYVASPIDLDNSEDNNENTPHTSQTDVTHTSQTDVTHTSQTDHYTRYNGPCTISNGELDTTKAPILRIGRKPQNRFPHYATLSAKIEAELPPSTQVEETPPKTLQQIQHPQEGNALPAPVTQEGETMEASPLDDMLNPPPEQSSIPATGKKAKCAPMPAHPAIGFLQELSVILRPILVDKQDHRTIPNPGEPAFKYQSRALTEYDALSSGSWASRKLAKPKDYLTPTPENKRHFERLRRAKEWIGNTSLMHYQLKTVAQLMVDTRSKSDKFAPFDSVADFLGIEGRDGWFAPWWAHLDAIDTQKAVEMVQKAEEAVLKDARSVRVLLQSEEWGDIVRGSDEHARFVKLIGREPINFREEVKKC